MKQLFTLLSLFSINICFAQTPKPKYLTQEEVIKIVKQLLPPNKENLFRDTDGDGVLDILDRQTTTPKDCPIRNICRRLHRSI